MQKLELERTQHQLLLESLQQRHEADLELIEGAHRWPQLSHLAFHRLWPPSLSKPHGWVFC